LVEKWASGRKTWQADTTSSLAIAVRSVKHLGVGQGAMHLFDIASGKT